MTRNQYLTSSVGFHSIKIIESFKEIQFWVEVNMRIIFTSLNKFTFSIYLNTSGQKPDPFMKNRAPSGVETNLQKQHHK